MDFWGRPETFGVKQNMRTRLMVLYYGAFNPFFLWKATAYLHKKELKSPQIQALWDLWFLKEEIFVRSRQKHRAYWRMVEAFNAEMAEIYLLKTDSNTLHHPAVGVDGICPLQQRHMFVCNKWVFTNLGGTAELWFRPEYLWYLGLFIWSDNMFVLAARWQNWIATTTNLHF